jgi:nicotinate-nucleotide adenylyltransferase
VNVNHGGILIFGGTFDPPHLAHTMLPPLAAAQLGCSRIIYVPAAINPLKLDTPPTAAHHRLAMLRLAVRPIPGSEISTTELDRAGPSYMIDTLETLANKAENAKLFLLIGADQALDFHRWREWPRVIDLARPAVMIRPPWTRESLEHALRERFDPREATQWLMWTLDLPRVEANATEIRRRLATGGDTSDMLDPSVRDYIEQHGLYGTSAG